MSVPQLQAILRRKGIPCVGKRKADLLVLCKQAEEAGVPDLEADDHQISEVKRRCVAGGADGGTISLYGREVEWTENMNGMPVVKDGNVFAYLFGQCQWSCERMDSFTQDDGYLMHKDSHCVTLKLGRIKDHTQHCYVEGGVIPEQRQGDKPYNTWLLLEQKTGKVNSAGCQCVAAYVFHIYFSLINWSKAKQTDYFK